MSHVFRRHDPPPSRFGVYDPATKSMRTWAKAATGLGIATVAVIIAAALDARAFSFEFHALTGDILEFVYGPSGRFRDFSMIVLVEQLGTDSIAASYADGLSLPTKMGVQFIQALYILFAMALPFAQLFLLLVLFVVPMTVRDQKVVFYAAFVVASLEALEVFLVSVVVAVLQLDEFSIFIGRNSCAAVTQLLHRDCFRVRTDVLSGVWWLLFASFSSTLFSRLVFSWCESVIEDRTNARSLASY